MVDNDTLRKRLRPHLKRLGIDEAAQKQLTKELNYLSSLIIEGYLRKKHGKQQATFDQSDPR